MGRASRCHAGLPGRRRLRQVGSRGPDKPALACRSATADRPVVRSRKSGGARLPRRVPSPRSSCRESPRAI